MIVCPRCSKENQDHYKFCLGCGAELPRDAEQPKSFSAPNHANTTAPMIAASAKRRPIAAPGIVGGWTIDSEVDAGSWPGCSASTSNSKSN